MKRQMLYGTVLLLCGLSGKSAFAATDITSLDCRHLFVEDVRLSDKIEGLRQKTATAETNGTDNANSGFFVKFDPIPGIGVMEGTTLSPAGKPLREDASETRIDSLQKQLDSVKTLEQRKVCATAPSTTNEEDRLLDDSVKPLP